MGGRDYNFEVWMPSSGDIAKNKFLLVSFFYSPFTIQHGRRRWGDDAFLPFNKQKMRYILKILPSRTSVIGVVIYSNQDITNII